MNKICSICIKNINEKKDNYCCIMDYSEGKQRGKRYYHSKCYIEKVLKRELTEMEKTAKNMLQRVGGLLNNLSGGKQIVEIK